MCADDAVQYAHKRSLTSVRAPRLWSWQRISRNMRVTRAGSELHRPSKSEYWTGLFMPASLTAFYIAPADAIELLRADHGRIRKLFADFERYTQEGARDKAEETAQRICREVMVHSRVEEE